MKATKSRATDNPARDESKPEGDVLGISHSPGKIPLHGPRRPSHRSPDGIDVRTPSTGIEDVQERSGATGADMGAGGDGTDVAQPVTRPASADRDKD